MPKVKSTYLTMQANVIELCSYEVFWEAVKSGDVTAMETLYFTDEHLTVQNSEGFNALHLAVIAQQAAMVCWLLLQGCPLEAQVIYSWTYSWTALHLAAQRTSYAILRDLLLAGAAGTVYDQAGWTPLHIAVSKGNVPFIELLTLKFPDLIHQADFQGWTPLHLAANGQQIEVVKALIKEGAQLDALGIHQETPLDIANQNPSQAAVAIWLYETAEQQQQIKQFLVEKASLATLKVQNESTEQRVIIAHQ